MNLFFWWKSRQRAHEELQQAIRGLLAFANTPLPVPAEIANRQSAMPDPRVGEFFRAVRRFRKDPQTLEKTLVALLPSLEVSDTVQASRMALLAGALVEQGADPTLAVGRVLDRLEGQLPPAGRFAALLKQRFGVEDLEEVSDEQKRAAAVDDLDGYKAWRGLEPMTMAAMTMLARDVGARQQARRRPALREGLTALGDMNPGLGYLSALLDLTDDLELLVLHPGTRQGFVVEAEGVANNFHLFTLLQCTLIGGGYLPGPRPSRRVCHAAQGMLPPRKMRDLAADAVWRFHPWFAWKADDSLHPIWLGGEHQPAGIPEVEGQRVVLLGAPGFTTFWDASFFPVLHNALRSHMRVVRRLDDSEVDHWRRRFLRAAEELELEGKSGCALCGLWHVVDADEPHAGSFEQSRGGTPGGEGDLA